MNYKELEKIAIEAAAKAYAPYSKFKVGAALLCRDGQIIQGCNIENLSFSLTNCAERTALFTAIAMGKKEFSAIAVYSPNAENPLPPCGACRQALSEFVKEDFILRLGDKHGRFVESSFASLFPSPFNESL